MRKFALPTFINWSVRAQLLFLAILLTLPSLGIIIYTGVNDRRDAYNNAAIESQKLADNIATEQQNMVDAAHQLGSVIAELPEVKSGNAAKLQPVLAKIIKINTQYRNIAIFDRFGNSLVSALPSDRHVSIADRRHFRNAAATHRFSSGEYVIGRYTDKPTIVMGYPLINEQGEFYGLIALGFDLERFERLLERSQLPPGTNYIITDHKGTIVTRGHDPSQFVGRQIKPGQLEQMQAGPDKHTFVFTRVDGSERITTYRKLYLSGEREPYMYVRAGLPLKATMAKSNREMLSNLSILFAFVVIAFALAVLIGKYSILDRIRKLQIASKRFAAGELRSKVSASVIGGELGELGLAFDDMASTLDQRISELLKAQEELAQKKRQLEDLNLSLEGRIESAIMDLRQKDQMLIQQGRQAAMGEMLNNIAHQWRQPLNNIGLIVQNLQVSYDSGELADGEMDTAITDAMNVIMYMSNTIDDFRNFFRHDKEKSTFIVNKVLARSLKFVVEALRSSGIRVEVTSEENVTTFGYQNEYSQVLLNIINNAKDVLLERNVDDPLISIRVFRENDHSVVTMRDNGGGIDADILPRIFDPYFTTKDKGTGIGLYMSKVIIEQNMGGTLTACNVDGGAEFRIEV